MESVTFRGCVSLCFLFKQKTAYEMRISDWSSDVCSSDLFEANTAGFDLLGVLSGGAPSVSFSAAASREIILGGANTYTGVTGIGGAGVVKASVLADGG